MLVAANSVASLHEGQTNNLRTSRIIDLLKEYRHQHSISALYREPPSVLCNRTFVINFQFDLNCHLIGNHYGSFMTGLLTAVVFNRTMIVANPPDCEGHLMAKDWLVQYKPFVALITAAGCNINLQEFTDTDLTHAFKLNDLVASKAVLNQRTITNDEIFISTNRERTSDRMGDAGGLQVMRRR